MGFNLSAWALRNRQIVLFLMLLLAIVGGLSYTKLGQSEDPPFTFKAMVIRTLWPGATAEEVSRQVTERRVRAHCFVLAPWRVASDLYGPRFDALESDSGAVVSGSQKDQ